MTLTEVKNMIKAGHFFLVPEEILEFDLSPAAFMVYFYLCCRSDAFGTSYPARKTIAKTCGDISVVTLDKALKELEEARLIEKHNRYTDEHLQTSNLYSVTDLKKRKKLFTEIKKEIDNGKYA